METITAIKSTISLETQNRVVQLSGMILENKLMTNTFKHPGKKSN